jgi:hypothetical protein
MPGGKRKIDSRVVGGTHAFPGGRARIDQCSTSDDSCVRFCTRSMNSSCCMVDAFPLGARRLLIDKVLSMPRGNRSHLLRQDLLPHAPRRRERAREHAYTLLRETLDQISAGGNRQVRHA